jgi:hypothetical protein
LTVPSDRREPTWTRDPLDGATKPQPPKPLKGAALRHIHA